MPDPADQSDHKIEAQIEDGIRAAREGRTGPFKNMRPTGFCHWCGDPIAADRLHCPPVEDSCAEDHEKYIKFRAETDGKDY